MPEEIHSPDPNIYRLKGALPSVGMDQLKSSQINPLLSEDTLISREQKKRMGMRV
jgi:hypothetical protein